MDVFAAPRTDEPSETTSPSPRRPRDRGCPSRRSRPSSRRGLQALGAFRLTTIATALSGRWRASQRRTTSEHGSSASRLDLVETSRLKPFAPTTGSAAKRQWWYGPVALLVLVQGASHDDRGSPLPHPGGEAAVPRAAACCAAYVPALSRRL